jgi:hypothetical protein
MMKGLSESRTMGVGRVESRDGEAHHILNGSYLG